jgi:hypothetical protein
MGAEEETGYSQPQSPTIDDNDETTQRQNEATPQKDDFPEGGYGWVCTIACAFINAHSWGMNSVSPSVARVSD